MRQTVRIKKQDDLTLDIIDAIGHGKRGNICHIDCSNRGICDYSTGLCSCFSGFTGTACEIQDVLAVGI